MRSVTSRQSVRSLPPIAAGTVARLRRAGLRPTAARVHMMLALDAAKVPMAAEDVFRVLSQQGVILSLGTAYRSLAELAAAGLLTRTWVQGHAGAKAAYLVEAATSPACDVAHRLICGRCGHSVAFVDAGLQEHLSQAVGQLRLKERQSLTVTVDCLGCLPACEARAQQGHGRHHRHAD